MKTHDVLLFAGLFALIALSACTAAVTPSAPATSTPDLAADHATAWSKTPSTPSLERAVDYEKGISKIPAGYYLFLEFRHREVCSGECNCAPEAPAPLYEITPKSELWIERDLDCFPTSPSPIAGFFVFNNWGGRVYAMDTLPFTLTPGDSTIATVYSIDAEGTAVVEVYGETYFIKPGQSWTDNGDMKQEPPAGCHISYSTSLTNFGLFSQTQIRFGYPDLNAQ